MTYKVTITYVGLTPADESKVVQICRMFEPNNSYTDTPPYAGSVYDTNVDGWGEHKMPEPYATTSLPLGVPLAQFKIAATGNPVEFEVDTFQEAAYWAQLGWQAADQGFSILVDGFPVPDCNPTSSTAAPSVKAPLFYGMCPDTDTPAETDVTSLTKGTPSAAGGSQIVTVKGEGRICFATPMTNPIKKVEEVALPVDTTANFTVTSNFVITISGTDVMYQLWVNDTAMDNSSGLDQKITF